MEKLVFGKEKKNIFPWDQEGRGEYVAEGHGCSCSVSLSSFSFGLMDSNIQRETERQTLEREGSRNGL